MKKLILFSSIAALALTACTTTPEPVASPESEGILPPVMGWSSWNTYGVNINEQLIKDQADAMVSQGLKDAGYLYVNTDDGYFGGRDEAGNLLIHPERFPNGMKPIADYIHSLGLKAGIYSDAGVNTCGSMWSNDPLGMGVGLYRHEKQDMDLFLKQWGFDFIKIDYCGGSEIGLDEKTQYNAIYDAIVGTGRTDVSFNICRWAYPGTWAEKIARSWRTTGDIWDGWKSVKGILMENLYLSAFCGNGHYNDMDMLEIGRSLTPDEEETHFGMWCIMSSPLLIGCDMTSIRPESLALLKNAGLIALNQDPLGLQAYVAQCTDGEHYVMVKDIEQAHGQARAVAFFNPGDEAYEFSIDLQKLELGGKVAVKDLIHPENDTTAEGVYTCTVPAHGTRVCRMEAEKRLESSVYEAEWGYLPEYNEISMSRVMIGTKANEKASEGMTVTNIGGRAENSIEWHNVYSEEGGEYDMTIYYATRQDRRPKKNYNPTGVLPTVNGTELPFVSMNSNTAGEFESVTLPITLQKGYNCIALTNPNFLTPDLDKFELVKK